MTVIIFVGGVCFGSTVGLLVGVIAETVWNLFPYPFVYPLATIAVLHRFVSDHGGALAALYGIVGGLRDKNWVPPKDMRSC